MSLHPFLIVGVGGSGGKTIRALKSSLRRQLQDIGWEGEFPTAWQFLHIDTPTNQEGFEEFGEDKLPLEEYLAITPGQLTYQAMVHSADVMGAPPRSPLTQEKLDLFGGWVPDPAANSVDPTKGAGQYRAIGRTLAVHGLRRIKARVAAKAQALGQARVAGELSRLADLLPASRAQNDSNVSGPVQPFVIIISSIAGGSGAGAVIDVAEAIKSCGPEFSRPAAFLYTPDVFHKIAGKAGVEANALGALSELMAGLWVDGEPTSSGTAKLYESKGIAIQTGAAYRLGPMYTFLIGRKNQTGIDFGDQDAVYQAVSTNLAAMMTDTTSQEFLFNVYFTNIVDGPDAAALRDQSELNLDFQRPPFSSYGFAQVSLGWDRFRQFAGQRLAREVVSRLIDQHQRGLTPAELASKSEKQIIDEASEANRWRFIHYSGIDERDDHNDILDALTPAEQDASLTNFEQAVRSRVGTSALPPAQWVERIQTALLQEGPSVRGAVTDARLSLARQWVRDIQRQLSSHVARYAVSLGMKVTERLVRDLIEEANFCVGQLREEAAESLRKAKLGETKIADKLTLSMGQMAAENENVQEAISICRKAIGHQLDSDRAALAAELLEDLAQAVLLPLQNLIGKSAQVLRDNFLGPDSQVSYRYWPDPATSDVPVTFSPALNEALLIEPNDFVSHFSALTAAATQGSAIALEKAANLVALGREEAAPDGGVNRLQYTLIDIQVPWIPKNNAVRPTEELAAASRSMVVSMETRPDAFLARADEWMDQSGSPFRRKFDETLSDYLKPDPSDPAGTQQRVRDFADKFQRALASSSPLISINAAVLTAIHPEHDATSRLVRLTPIPVAEGSPLAQQIKDLMLGADPNASTDSVIWDPSSGAKAVNITTYLSLPVQPMVLDSIMQPIATTWNAILGTQSQRATFWRARRARPLLESIPAAPSVVEAMVRGWCIGVAIGMVQAKEPTDLRDPAPAVWDAQSKRWLEFPWPALTLAGERPSTGDMLGAVLQSLMIAIAQCNLAGANALEPLKPYARLKSIGGLSQPGATATLSQPLRDYLAGGASAEEGFPSLGDSWDERKQTLAGNLEASLQQVKLAAERTYAIGDPYRAELGWELHQLREKVLNDLIAALRTYELEAQVL
jgi:hypothetical protein